LRFARDLHDLLGHSLSVIVLKSELAGRLAAASPERAADEIGDVERVAREALREVRQVVAGYRQPSLGRELESARLILQAAGITTRVDASAGRLHAASESTLAWAVREGVTNIVRHSRAQNAYIKLARADDHVGLEVIDDGVGYDGPTHGSGLSGLGERVSAQDGVLTFGRRPEGGFRLAVELPLREAPQPAAAEPS
jgi:two-component system sensor histidine kinase DesK